MAPKAKDPFRTVLTISTGFLALYFLIEEAWCLYVALGAGILGILSKGGATWLEYLWMKLAQGLSFIVPNIILSVVFFFILTPIAFASRFFQKKDPLDLRNDRDSFFQDRDGGFAPSSFERPW